MQKRMKMQRYFLKSAKHSHRDSPGRSPGNEEHPKLEPQRGGTILKLLEPRIPRINTNENII